MAADYEGRWITFEGFVDLSVTDDIYEGHLRTSEDSDPLDHIRISSDDGQELHALITPPDPATPPYQLIGNPFIGKTKHGRDFARERP